MHRRRGGEGGVMLVVISFLIGVCIGAAGREPDARSWAAVEVARRYVAGEVTGEEFAAAGAAARAAAWAAEAAARAAAWAAAKAAAEAAAKAAERAWQTERLFARLEEVRRG